MLGAAHFLVGTVVLDGPAELPEGSHLGPAKTIPLPAGDAGSKQQRLLLADMPYKLRQSVYFLLCGLRSKGYPHRPILYLGRQRHSFKNMAGLAPVAGGAGGDADPWLPKASTTDCPEKSGREIARM